MAAQTRDLSGTNSKDARTKSRTPMSSYVGMMLMGLILLAVGVMQMLSGGRL
jgi:hypothetical protein